MDEYERYYGWKLVAIWAGMLGVSWTLAFVVIYAIAWVLQ